MRSTVLWIWIFGAMSLGGYFGYHLFPSEYEIFSWLAAAGGTIVGMIASATLVIISEKIWTALRRPFLFKKEFGIRPPRQDENPRVLARMVRLILHEIAQECEYKRRSLETWDAFGAQNLLGWEEYNKTRIEKKELENKGYRILSLAIHYSILTEEKNLYDFMGCPQESHYCYNIPS